MNLDELQSVQSRERQASKLQHLRASFYEEAGEYIGGLRADRNELAAESDNPFDDPEIAQISDRIKTAERTVESIYERRVGKVVKLASIAAAGMPCDDEGLTTEEERLFERLVDAIEGNRECVLSVLDGETPALDCAPTGEDRSAAGAEGTSEEGPSGGAPASGERVDSPDPGAGATDPGAGGVTDVGRERAPDSGGDGNRPAPPDGPVGEGSATGPDPQPASAEDTADGTVGPGDAGVDDEPLDIAGAMGGSSEESRPEPRAAEAVPATGTGAATGAESATPSGDAGDADGRADGRSGTDEEPVDRTTIRVTGDVGEVFGVDGRAYDLSPGDVVTLPTPNADGLLSKDAAERLE